MVEVELNEDGTVDEDILSHRDMRHGLRRLRIGLDHRGEMGSSTQLHGRIRKI